MRETFVKAVTNHLDRELSTIEHETSSYCGVEMMRPHPYIKLNV